MKRRSSIYLAACAVSLFTQAVRADHITKLYGNSAGSNGIQIFNVTSRWITILCSYRRQYRNDLASCCWEPACLDWRGACGAKRRDLVVLSFC